jgi:hypothetical protein
MPNELKELSYILTSWILEAFSTFAPKRTGGRMGTAQIRGKGLPFPADFFPNLRKILTFSSPAYCLLSTADCFSLPVSDLSLNRAILSLNQANLSLNPAILSLNQANLSLPEAILSLPKRDCSLL